MEYSTEDIVAARSLQLAAYINASMATFWVYDFACSLHEECTYLLRSQWSKVKCLYIITRYLPFIVLTTSLYLSFNSGGNPGKCRGIYDINTGLGIVSVICSEWFFILRTYALWNKNRILLVTMLSIFFIFLAVSFSVSFATMVPAACIRSNLSPGVPSSLKYSVHFHRCN
jgi:hypothetical protein